ncbi:MAG TPA: carboxypeptidase regulatory-like domain-containing protein [Terracidiphilus sp.]|nr:carboxypeptidase regulatory-like domain-containing protein [Terracidiphilus sp.]
MKQWFRTKFVLGLLLLPLLLAVSSTRAAFAQVETGQIAGTVTDQSGAVVPNATVIAKNLGTNAERTTQTNATGFYQLTGLAAARYQITINAGSFKPYTAKAEVTVGARVALDVKLSVDSTIVEVQVVGEGGVQVNTQSQEISQVINSEQVAQLPSLTRNPYDFVAISGNISNGDAGSSGSSSSQNSSTRGVGFAINGQRSSGTEILLDGVENVSVFGDSIGINVPLDAMQEYRVSTSNFEAQFGRASGGVVNVTTKGGTNAFHGNAWEYNRLSSYTANTETNDQEGSAKGVYTRNQFGFTAGGPVLKDKLFVFGSAEWTRVRSNAVGSAAVPTPEFLAAAGSNIQDFFNTYGGKTFTYTQTYSASDVYGSSLPTGLDGSTPMFGVVSFTGPQNAGGGVPQNTYNYLIRGDYNPNATTQMFFRYVNYHEVDQAGSSFISPYSQYNVGQTDTNQAYLYSLTHEFTPTLVSATKLSFSRFNTFQSYDTSLQNVPTLVVSPNATVPGTGIPIQLPGFYDTNPANGGLPFGGPQNTVQINEDLNWVKGKHSMQYGTQLIYIQDNEAYGAYAQANEQLGSSKSAGLQQLYFGDNMYEFQAAVNPNGALPCVRDPYTGALTQTTACTIQLPASSPSFARSDRFKDWAVYAQDSFRLTPQFTANYGVRYEYYGVQHNNNPSLDSNYYYGSGSTIAERERNGAVYTVPNSPIHSLWNPTYGAVSPRIGFAYDVFGNGKDSIRGGYGIAYERNFGNVTFNVIQNPPNYAVVVINGTPVTTSNAGPLAGTSGGVALPPTSLRHVDQDIKTAQTQFWSLALEHQITHNTLVSAQYVGARGIHLYDIKNYNGLGSGNAMLGDPITDPQGRINSSTGKVYQALTRLNPQYSNANNRGSSGDSYYQGLNVEFQTTNLHQTGLSITANYTMAHALDNLSSTFSESNNAFSLGYTDPFNPALDHGNGDLDVRHRLVIAPIYSEPFFKNQRNLTGQVLGGWQLAGIYQAHTGTPFTFFDSTNNGTGYNVARYTPVDTVTKHSFTSIPSGQSGGGTNTYVLGQLPGANSWGNANLLGISDWGPWPNKMTSRNEFRGPGFWNLDLVLSKTFPIREKTNLEFRAEGFNILNHHNLFLQEANNDVYNYSDVDSAGYVTPSILASKGGIGNNGGANDERRFGQFALKLNF